MLHRLLSRPSPERRDAVMSWQQYQTLFSLNGSQYLVGDPMKSRVARSLVHECGPAYAVLDRRASVMGEVRLVFQRLEKGKPTGLWSDDRLRIVERPWPGGTLRMLVAAMEADVAAYGNSYWVRQGSELVRLDPDRVTIVTEDVTLDEQVIGNRLAGYAVQMTPGAPGVIYEPGQVAHYRPSPSVNLPWRGESWLAAVAPDASSDVEMTLYKHAYLRNGAMPSVAILYEPTLDPAMVEDYVSAFSDKFVGHMNAGKVMHFLGGRDIKTVGATLDQLAFKAVQGAGETRIAAAAGVPAVVAGFSEGMQGSSLNAGNYVATRRLFADAKVRPLLGSLCDALSAVVNVPSGNRLWFDDSGVSFFQEDVRDEAEIRQQHAATIRTLIEAGYDPDAAVAAVTTGNFAALSGKHSGLTSVQLQPPQDGDTPDPDDEEGADDAQQ